MASDGATRLVLAAAVACVLSGACLASASPVFAQPAYDDAEAQLRIKHALTDVEVATREVEQVRKSLETERRNVPRSSEERELNQATITALEKGLRDAEAKLKDREQTLKQVQEARARSLEADTRRRQADEDSRRAAESAETVARAQREADARKAELEAARRRFEAERAPAGNPRAGDPDAGPYAVPSRVFDERLKREHAQTGEVQITLVWEVAFNLDLSIECPDGNLIAYWNKHACGGTLEFDMNSGDRNSSTPVENIFFPRGSVPWGKSKIYVQLSSRHDDMRPLIPFKVRIKDGADRIISGMIGVSTRLMVGEITR